MDIIPIWVLFTGTILVVMLAIEIGHSVGIAIRKRSQDETEATVSTMTGSVLALVAFILAFTFGIVTNRYDAKRQLIIQEANAIGTAFLRTDFLPEPDRREAAGLLKKYVDDRLAAARSGDLRQVQVALAESVKIQRRLWEMAVINARKDMNSDVAALYIESLNEVIDIQSERVAVGLQARIPIAIWIILYILVILGMLAVGYQSAIAGSKRSWATPLLALAFSLVIGLIASLDRPQSGHVIVSQQPLADLQASMAASLEAKEMKDKP